MDITRRDSRDTSAAALDAHTAAMAARSAAHAATIAAARLRQASHVAPTSPTGRKNVSLHSTTTTTFTSRHNNPDVTNSEPGAESASDNDNIPAHHGNTFIAYTFPVGPLGGRTTFRSRCEYREEEQDKEGENKEGGDETGSAGADAGVAGGVFSGADRLEAAQLVASIAHSFTRLAALLD